MNWAQLGYQYGVGGLFFLVTLALCFQPGASKWSNSADRKSFLLSVIGLTGYFLVTLLWIVAAEG